MLINNEFNKGISLLKSEDYTSAVQHLEPIAHIGNSDAQFFMGLINARGWSVPRNRAIAQNWIKRSCNPPLALRASDCAEPFFYIGEDMLTNPTSTADRAEGVHWLRLAANAGSLKAAKKMKELEEYTDIKSLKN